MGNNDRDWLLRPGVPNTGEFVELSVGKPSSMLPPLPELTVMCGGRREPGLNEPEFPPEAIFNREKRKSTYHKSLRLHTRINFVGWFGTGC